MFAGRILITGFGIVAQALLPLLLKRLRVSPDRITVIEFAERPQLRPWRKRGVRLVRERVTPAACASPRTCRTARSCATPRPTSGG